MPHPLLSLVDPVSVTEGQVLHHLGERLIAHLDRNFNAVPHPQQ